MAYLRKDDALKQRRDLPLVWAGVCGVFTGVSGLLTAAPSIEEITIGASPGGLPIVVQAVGETARDQHGRGRDERPALVIVAGLCGTHQIGIEVAAKIGAALIDQHAQLLAERTVYILPVLNPEGAEKFRTHQPRALYGRAPESQDADRDGRFDEDPPNDIDGDGLILMMRVPAPNAQYGLEATHMIDPEDGRLMRALRPEKGELATHALLIEGWDNDGDGRFNEDGWGGTAGGGVDLDRNFPTHWPDLAEGAGLYPLDRPETLALVRWLQDRTNVIGVVVYGHHDTIASIPAAGQYGPEGRVPKGIEKEDQSFYEIASEAFRKITGISKGSDSDRSGSFVQWAYADLGVYAFSTPIWVRPDLVKREDQPSSERPDGETAVRGESSSDAAVAADRQALVDRGVPQQFIEFLYMSEEERQAEMEAIGSAPPETQEAMMEQLQALPDDVRARVMAVAQGQADPGRGVERAPVREAPSRRGGRPSSGQSEDAAWLAWIDEHRGGEGFVDWKPFDHPQLGPVEIGGFVPGVRVNPPEEDVARLLGEQTEFVAWILERMPKLEVESVEVARIGPGLWRVGVVLRNDGFFPTVSGIGQKVRRLPETIAAFDPDLEMDHGSLLGGDRIQRLPSIQGSGGTARAEWLVRSRAGREALVEIRSARFGNRALRVTLEETR